MVTHTVLGFPYYNFGKVYPQALLQLLRPLQYTHYCCLGEVGWMEIRAPGLRFCFFLWGRALGFRIWEFPKVRGTLFWGPCNFR